MSLNPLERELLQKAADSAAAASTSAAETAVAVKNIGSQTAELFQRVRKTENDLVAMETKYDGCGARKSYDAGIMPGDKSARKAAFWAMIGGVVAGGAVIGSIISPIARALIQKVFGG